MIDVKAVPGCSAPASRGSRRIASQPTGRAPGGASPRSREGEAGFALMFVLLLAMAVAALAIGASMVQSNTTLISRYQSQNSVLETVADAGLEQARAEINANDSLYPDSGYDTLENNARVYDASGNQIPDVHRSIWVGPTGITTGQYGVFGSIVVEATDSHGNQVVRRQEIRQESFAKYAYFTDIEPSNIAFGSGDQIFGPVHSNDFIKIYSTGATFWNHVTTAKTVQGAQYGNFPQGYTENAPPIAMPKTAQLSKLKVQAQAGHTYFSGDNNGQLGQATTRIEFMAIDLNGDGKVTGDDEGFIRVYQSSNAGWVVADMPETCSYYGCTPESTLQHSLNCGHYHNPGTANDSFVVAANHTTSSSGGGTSYHGGWGGRSGRGGGSSGGSGGTSSSGDTWQDAVTDTAGSRCYLGGSDTLSNGFLATDSLGGWVAWGGPSYTLPVSRSDHSYLIPLNRTYNPDFKGVIFVDGNVAISGTVRGNVTLAATGNIVIADDVKYATDPGAGTCNDLLGLFAGNDVVVADNTLNSPIQGTGSYYYTYDDTKDEFIQAVVLALNQFTVENFSSGSSSAEPCEGTSRGRGCLYLTGGIIQKTRGAVGLESGQGYLKRYSYDACAATAPPPYFPTTGHFTRGVYYEVNPSNFSVANLFQSLTPSS